MTTQSGFLEVAREYSESMEQELFKLGSEKQRLNRRLAEIETQIINAGTNQVIANNAMRDTPLLNAGDLEPSTSADLDWMTQDEQKDFLSTP